MGSTIDLKSADGFTLSAYTAGPAGGTKGIVVIQEIFGVNHHMRDMCRPVRRRRATRSVRRRCSTASRRGVELGYTQADIDERPRLPHEAG